MNYQAKRKRTLHIPYQDAQWDDLYGDGFDLVEFYNRQTQQQLQYQQHLAKRPCLARNINNSPRPRNPVSTTETTDTESRTVANHETKDDNEDEDSNNVGVTTPNNTARTTDQTNVVGSSSNLSYPTTLHSEVYDRNKASRRLVLRCWERALHAASKTITVRANQHQPTLHQPTTSLDNAPPSPATIECPASPRHYHTYSRQQAQEKCRALGIQLPAKATSATNTNVETTDTDDDDNINICWSCPSCGSTAFRLSLKHLEDHFYGTEEKTTAAEDTTTSKSTTTTRACCWSLVEQTQLQVLRSILDSEVQVQAGLLVRHVVGKIFEVRNQPSCNDMKNNVAAASAKNSAFRPEKGTLQWHDVLQVLNRTVQTAQVVKPPFLSSVRNDPTTMSSSPSVRDTLKVEVDQQPIVLNPSLMEVVSNRIIQRYAKIPK
ncbi:hypothetical protein ACA910_014454 [Epithemia clementina (nom. ined.)]